MESATQGEPISLSAEIGQRLARQLSAMGNVHRLRILSLLVAGPRHVSEMVAHLGLAQSTVSQHLTILREAELVAFDYAGPRHLYRARLEVLDEVACAVGGIPRAPH